MFRILFDLLRSSILNKDLLLHVNPYVTLENVHTELAMAMAMAMAMVIRSHGQSLT